MLFRNAKQGTKSGYLTYPLLAARRFVRAFMELGNPSQKQQVLLAAAHYTLAGEQNLSLPRSTLHLNTAITLLRKAKPPYPSFEWQRQLAQAYFRRAERLEQKQCFNQACYDYQQTIDLLQDWQPVLQDSDCLLLARAALCMADLINHRCIDPTASPWQAPEHALVYVNQALSALEAIQQPSDTVSIAHAYAHQMAGMSLGSQDFAEAKQALETALSIALSTQSIQTPTLLADIYTCLGLLYEQHSRPALLSLVPDKSADDALIYFGLSLLFGTEEMTEDPEDYFALDCLFDMIYSVLDPMPFVLPEHLSIQLVDALIQAYTCVVQKTLPNHILLEQLTEGDALDSFARHIYWLVLEVHAQQHAHLDFIPALISKETATLPFIYKTDALFTEETPNNVYYLHQRPIHEKHNPT